MMENFAMHLQVFILILLGAQELGAASGVSVAEQEPTASLRGGLHGLILNELDPKWWQATTSTASPSTRAQPTTITGASGQSPASALIVKRSVPGMITEMNRTESSVKKLELELEALHTRLLQAEKTSVNAAGNVSLAREGMYKLASRFRDEADQMKEVQSIASFSENKLDSVQSNLISVQKTIRGSAQNLASAASVANKSASAQDKQRQEDLHNQIWDLVDPSKDDSLVATEKKVDELYDQASKFQTKLEKTVKTVMMTKMRRQVQKFRKASMRLGSAARANSASSLDELGGGSSLGDDLGLNDDEQ